MSRSLLILVWMAVAAALPLRLPAAEPDAGERFLEKKVEDDPIDFIAWNKLGDKYLELLRFTGDNSYLDRAAQAAGASLKALRPARNAGGLGLRGRVEMAAHQFAGARETAKQLQELQPQKTGGWLLEGDALLELGDYSGAERLFKEVVRREEEVSVGSESRFARLEIIHGRLKKARAHFENALVIAEQLETPPEIVAWCEVQLGELAFKQGDWAQAEKQYLAAGETLPDWYVVEDHVAELRGAQGRTDEAIALYTKLLERTPRPELWQALGDLQVFAGRKEAAQPAFEKARALYARSLERGEVMYLHHASGFYADSTAEPEKALAAAQQDIASRQSIYAWDTLAWAQYGSGELKEAAASIQKALSTGTHEAHLIYHAGMIRMSIGDLAGGREALRQTVEINPRYATFHVHR